MPRGWVSYMRTATISPEAAVSAATTQMAVRMPKRSASEAGEQGADGEAAVAPQAVDADGAGAPGRVGDVADDGEQGRVDHGGAGAEQDGGHGPQR